MDDPNLEKLMRAKAEASDPLDLVKEIETLHDGLHQACEVCSILILNIEKVRGMLEETITKATTFSERGANGITLDLSQINAEIIKAIHNAKNKTDI